MRMYYTLLTREPGGIWSPQFGDYDKSTVVGEGGCYHADGYRRKDLKVICTGARQSDINAEVSRLNTPQTELVA
jgi:hypothetical protein